jgi:uncharacterized membrane protein
MDKISWKTAKVAIVIFVAGLVFMGVGYLFPKNFVATGVWALGLWATILSPCPGMLALFQWFGEKEERKEKLTKELSDGSVK